MNLTASYYQLNFLKNNMKLYKTQSEANVYNTDENIALEEYKKAMMSLGLLEDEAERMIEDFLI